MKTAFPWILVAVLLGGVYFLATANKEKKAQIAALQEQASEVATLRAENEELHRQPSQADEMARLKKDSEDLLRLRSENQQLRNQIKQAASQTTGSKADLDRAEQEAKDQIAKLAQENEALKAAQAAGAGQTPAQEQAASCIANLRQLSMAKQLWAQDNKKGPEEVPTTDDLKPYFPNIDKIVCPEGGTYTIGAVNAPPTCSIPGHTLAPQLPPQQ